MVQNGRVMLPEGQTLTPVSGSEGWIGHPVPQFPTSVLLDVVVSGAGESSGFLYLLTSLCLSLPRFMVSDDGGPLFLDAQKKTPMTVLGSPHTLKPSKPPCLATQGKSWKRRRKVRCPSSDGLLHASIYKSL